MISGEQLSEQVYDLQHIKTVLRAIEDNFPKYFSTFKKPAGLFEKAIKDHQKEFPAYQRYLDLEGLDEFETNPNSFKRETKTNCPIIRRCLMAQDEVMRQYQISFSTADAQDLLATIYNIANFGEQYCADFDHKKHERSKSYEDLGLEDLSDEDYGYVGVVGYGIQSALLYSLYPYAFAHRSQNAVWALYFLSGKKDFGLGDDGSEFLMIRPQYGTCEQNYLYPPKLFGYYALQVYLTLKKADPSFKNLFLNEYRYTYLDIFFDHIADTHRNDINVFKRSSEHADNYWH